MAGAQLAGAFALPVPHGADLGCGRTPTVGRGLLRIRDPAVQHAAQREAEDFHDLAQFVERQFAVVELMIGHAVIDDLVDQFLDALRGRFFQAARRAFHRVGQADDGAFLRRGSGPL